MKMPDDDKDKFDLSKDPAFTKLLETMGTLGQMVKEGQVRNAATDASIDKLTAALREDRKPAAPKGKTEEEVDDMSQSELLNHMMSGVADLMDTKVGSLSKNLDAFRGEVDNKDAKTVIRDFAKDHPEVYGYGKELQKIFTDTPGISMERAYNLVKFENPELVKDVEKEYLGKDEEDKSKKPRYGGLTPTSRITSGDDDTGGDEKKMDATEAANTAWNEALEDFPALGSEG